MNLRETIASLLRPEPKRGPGDTYREPAPVSGSDAVRELGKGIAALQLRVRILEAQLRAEGTRPIYTPRARDVADVVEILDGLARGEQPHKDTLTLRILAASLRGLLELED